MTARFGAQLRRWRTHRRLSQLDLATQADVSQRHISFLETGRAKPSREMVGHLAVVLDLPLRERNDLLMTAGFAPAYPETDLDVPAMDQVRHVLDFVLAAHEPFPAIVIDRRWDVVMLNGAASRFTAALMDGPPASPPNLARLSFHPDGLRRVTVNWPEAGAALLQRLEREVASRPADAALRALCDEVTGYPGVAELRTPIELPSGEDLLFPIHYRTDGLDIRMFSTIATIGAPFDVTLDELRLETFFPADAESERALRRLAAEAS